MRKKQARAREAGKITILKGFLAPVRQELIRKREATERFETGPGKQAQVDWAGFSRTGLEGLRCLFPELATASAILDRLLHHSTTINIRGESYRLKDKRRAGLFQRLESAPEIGKSGEK